MNISSTPFIRNDYWPDYNDINQVNQRIDDVENEISLVNIRLSADIENVSNNLNSYAKDQADTSISNNIIVNNLNANYVEGRFANFDNTFTNNAYVENLTVNKPVFDITLNTPHLENTTSLNGNFYTPNIIDAKISGDVSGNLNNISINDLLANNANVSNLYVNISPTPVQSSAVLGYDSEGKVIPIRATFEVGFPENADYLWTDEHGTAFSGVKATEIGEVENLITAYGVKNAIDVVNANFNNVDNSFNDVNNSFNNVNNRIETEMSNIAENFNTDNLSANNAVISNLNTDNLSANNAATNSLNVDSLSANNTATNNLDVSDITIEKAAGDNGQVIGKSDGKVKWVNVTDVNGKAIIDMVWPIGVIYTQFPQQKSPQELFPNTTWEVVNYDGAFFRAAGGNAAAFIEKSGVLSKQGQSIQSHKHSASFSGNQQTGEVYLNNNTNGGSPIGKCSGIFSSIGSAPINLDSGSWTSVPAGFRLSITPSGSVSIDKTGSTETKPANYTIRVWKRTA